MEKKNIKTMSLPISPWQEVGCRVLKSDGATTTIPGRRIVYLSGPRPPVGHDFRIHVTEFYDWPTRKNWIGLESDVYIHHNDELVGLKVLAAEFVWNANLATDKTDQSLDDATAAFERNVSGDELADNFLRSFRAHVDGDETTVTRLGNVIPQPYLKYLQTSGGSSAGPAKFVAAAMDGELLKVTIADPEDNMFPSVWVDIKTRKAMKAENFEFDPVEESNKRIQKILEETRDEPASPRLNK